MKSFRTISEKFDVILFDAYGVFNINGKLVPSALKVMEDLVSVGKKVGIVSNTTQISTVAEASYAKKGLIKGKHYHIFLTSGQVVYESIQAQNLEVPGARYYVFGTPNFKNPDPVPSLFSSSCYVRVNDLSNADFIYCGIPQICGEDRVNLEDFRPSLEELSKTKLPMLCANPDMKSLEDGRFVIRQGSISQLYQEMGNQVIYYGKPDARILDQAVALLGGNKSETLMVGDTLVTDVLAANRAGVQSCLTISGGITEDVLISANRTVNVENIQMMAQSLDVKTDYICFRIE